MEQTWRRFLAIQVFGPSEEDLENANFVSDSIAIQEVLENFRVEGLRAMMG